MTVAAKSSRFQSLDWVDVDFDAHLGAAVRLVEQFQSLDWVDVDFDQPGSPCPGHLPEFQSLDWVDVDFDRPNSGYCCDRILVSIPRLG